MKCFHCKKKIEETPSGIDGVWIGCDGDALHHHCVKDYEREKDHFLNHTVQSEDTFLEWMNGGNP